MDHDMLQLDIHQNIATISMDMTGKSANVLSMAMIDALEKTLSDLEARGDLDGFILCSAKPSGFVFGADITEFETLPSQEAVRALQAKAMKLLDHIESSHLVSVAVIHGPVLGGGLELALACDYRVAPEKGRIMAGFPEANLGLIPGFAGTARAARLMGGAETLALCLSARPLTKQQQLYDIGLVDGLIGQDRDEAVLSLIGKGKRNYDVFCDSAEWDSQIDEAQAHYIKGRVPLHQPHLVALIDHMRQAGPDFKALMQGELSVFPQLMMSDISKNLRRVFALTDLVKKQVRGKTDIKSIEVIGAGAMGADIASYLCLKGFNVRLTDIQQDARERAYQQIKTYLRRKLGDEAGEQALAHLELCETIEPHLQIELVIEAVPEKLALKQAIWQEIEGARSATCLLATNSSALDLDDISASMKAPARLTGLHFFNPATVMPLIEVIHRDGNDEKDIAQLMLLSSSIGKYPILVGNSPGFLVNRALLPYIFKAIESLCEGQRADEIDEALLDFGMPMGPLELADQIGLDICLDVGARLGIQDAVKSFLEDHIEAGHLGRKTGQGIYEWDAKTAKRPRASYDKNNGQAISERLLAPLVNECQASLSEGHVSSAEFVDAAMIYGVGFPRHTGGPLHFAKQK